MTKNEAEEYATLDDLLQSGEKVDFDSVTVDGKTWHIGSLTAEDFIVWNEMRESGSEGKKNAGALIILRSLVNKQGDRIGDDSKLPQARKMKLKLSETLLKHIFKLNGVSTRAEDAVKNA